MKPHNDAPRFHTFDLFDTLIARTVLRPEDLFLTVGTHLRQAGLWNKHRNQFRKLRAAAAAVTAHKLRLEEITLDQIYETLASRTGWNSSQASQAQAIEIEVELASVRPIVEMCARWKAIDPSRRAIVSDTYFSLDVIRQMLDRCDIPCDPDRLFLSSICGARKSTGRLFRVVAKSLGTDPGRIHHVGDNPHSDLACARKEGFSAELYRSSAPSRYESAIQFLDGGDASRILGALRTARLAFPGGTHTERTLWEVGTMVAGPILFSYVS